MGNIGGFGSVFHGVTIRCHRSCSYWSITESKRVTLKVSCSHGWEVGVAKWFLPLHGAVLRLWDLAFSRARSKKLMWKLQCLLLSIQHFNVFCWSYRPTLIQYWKELNEGMRLGTIFVGVDCMRG